MESPYARKSHVQLLMVSIEDEYNPQFFCVGEGTSRELMARQEEVCDQVPAESDSRC